MAKHKKHPEHVNNERWLVSYADFITLLFAFFVVMFAVAPKDDKSSRKISAVTQSAFSSFSIFGPGGDTILKENKMRTDDDGLPMTDRRVDKSEQLLLKRSFTGLDYQKNFSTQDSPYKPDSGIRDVMTQEFYKSALETGASVRMESRGLSVSFSQAVLFEEGSDSINKQSIGMIKQIMQMAKDRNNTIQVEGHTDNTEAGDDFKANMDLSSKRALNVAEILIKDYGIPRELVSIASFGPSRPVSENDTKKNKALNRRVDILFLKTVADKNKIALPDVKNFEEQPISNTEADSHSPDIASEGVLHE